MTSKQGPVHAYVVVLFLFEFVMGITTAAMIIIVFTYAPMFADTFWWNYQLLADRSVQWSLRDGWSPLTTLLRTLCVPT